MIMERSARKPTTAKDEIDNWDKDVPLPKWLDEVELLGYDEAVALAKLGVDVRGWWYGGDLRKVSEPQEWWWSTTEVGRIKQIIERAQDSDKIAFGILK